MEVINRADDNIIRLIRLFGEDKDVSDDKEKTEAIKNVYTEKPKGINI